MSLDTNSTIVGANLNDSVYMQVDPSFNAGRVHLRPTEFTLSGLVGGHFACDAITGAVAGATGANGQLLSVRWADSRMLFLLKRLSVNAVCTAFAAAALPDLELIRATSFTGNATTNGSTVTPATSAQKMRTATMTGSLFTAGGQIYVAGTAAITGATQTLDTAGIACCPMGNFSAANIMWPTGGTVDLYRLVAMGQHPLILGVNEGFVVRTPTGWGSSTISLKLYFTMEWAEIPAF